MKSKKVLSVRSRNKKSTKNNKSFVGNIIICICVLVMIVSGTFIAKDLKERFNAKKEIKGLQAIKPEISYTANTPKETLEEKYAELKGINSDYVGWLSIPDSDIDLPVVQCSDNDYYLKVSFRDEYNSAGCLFLDCGNDSLFQDQNSVIYGHAMLDGTMFGELKKYREQAYYESHPFIYVLTEHWTYVYQVYSVNVVTPDYDYRRSNYGEDFNYLLSDIKPNSYVSSSAYADSSSKMLTLSTCTGMNGENRLVVFAVLLNPDGTEVDTSKISL